MKQKLFFLNIFLFLNIGLFGQKPDTLVTEFKKVLFIVSSSEFEFTRFWESSGIIYFNSGFIDSAYNTSGRLYTSDKKNSFKQTISVFRYVPGIDTIVSYFPVADLNSDPFTLTAELINSYILNQLKEPKQEDSHQSFVRLLYPEEDLNLCKDYTVLRIHFVNDSAALYKVTGRSSNLEGLHIVKIDSIQLKKGDINRIKNQWSKVNLDSAFDCRKPGIQWSWNILTKVYISISFYPIIVSVEKRL